MLKSTTIIIATVILTGCQSPVLRSYDRFVNGLPGKKLEAYIEADKEMGEKEKLTWRRRIAMARMVIRKAKGEE